MNNILSSFQRIFKPALSNVHDDPNIMTREQKALMKVDKKKIGLEIGPSHAPLAPRKKGFKVHIIDHMNKEQLIELYKTHQGNVENIEEVDFVWQGQSYAELTGKRNYYNWIIASHLIEHTPDLISFLKQCEEVLKEDGVLSLVVPDIRYHFDYFRPITGISKVIDAYFNRNIIQTPGTVAEFFLYLSKRGSHVAWEEGFKEEFSLAYNSTDAINSMQRVIQHREYLDSHAWSFTPTSFRLMIQDLNDLKFISLKELCFFETKGCEFFITLSKQGAGFSQARLGGFKNN
ncbi:MAG: methyltransferase domain-containing protein [Chitinophagaceae bacterium]